MDVPMELSRIIISEYGGEQYIFLREKGKQRTFPIVIGIAEALAIDRRLKGLKTQRPMTHDLLAHVIERFGGKVEKIVINDLQQLPRHGGPGATMVEKIVDLQQLVPDDLSQTFIATIYIRHDGQLMEIDSRPSDAIALGIAGDTPIFVAEHVLEAVLREPPTQEAKLDLLRRRMEMLASRIAELNERLSDDAFLDNASEAVINEHRRELADKQTEYDAIDRVLKKFG